MNPNRVDFVVDLAYGLMIFVAVVLFSVVGNQVGIAFGLGVLISYAIHVFWKMARFDPEWMTQEVTENVEETLKTEVDAVIERLEEVNDRVDRRPRADEVEEAVDESVGKVSEDVEKTVEEKVGEVTKDVEETVEKVSEDVEKTVEETVGETVEKTVGETVEKTVEEQVGETVEGAVEETVEETVEGTVEETVEKTVEETVEETVGDTVEETVDKRIEEVVDEDAVEDESGTGSDDDEAK
ncbi:hypothetical protein [Halorubrum cibi]|uniref:Glutamate/valine-rich protein n=1 Tax=Halorubrum cibi TaxID=413815 RepID=A0A521EXH6_9EURY|nr:hypothetical protein [Halorubrum cibi]SMO88101.1 hypothetical protein SAMN06264867_1138 [Halorubrum cibi]